MHPNNTRPNISWLTNRPIAHRGLHNAKAGIFENTLSACKAAIDNKYSIEVDMHPSCDGKVMIFHDSTLERMANDRRNIRDLSAAQLRQVSIHNTNDYVATLDELLELTDGRTGLVLEMKGIPGKDDGFVRSIANSLKNYHGPVAIMSFYHWLLKDARTFAGDIPLGLTAQGDDKSYASHKSIAYECDVDFVSYKIANLPCKFSQEFRNSGKPMICWTVKTADDMRTATPHSDQITFEGFIPEKVSASIANN